MKMGDIGQQGEWRFIVLNVTGKDIDSGINTNRTGLHGFRGMWYGEDPMDVNSFGKIINLDDSCKIIGSIKDYNLEDFKEMIDG